ATRADRIASASDSHRRVEPSISVNKNVTTPEGGPPADTRTGCHKAHFNGANRDYFRDSRNSISRQADHRVEAALGPTAACADWLNSMRRCRWVWPRSNHRRPA